MYSEETIWISIKKIMLA